MAIQIKKTDELVKKMMDDLGQKAEPKVIEKVARKVEKALGLKNKVTITLRLEPETIAYFKEGGSGYQVRISAALKDYIERNPR